MRVGRVIISPIYELNTTYLAAYVYRFLIVVIQTHNKFIITIHNTSLAPAFFDNLTKENIYGCVLI